MTLSSNARRRLALYGSALAVAALVLLAPVLVRSLRPPVPVRRDDLRAAELVNAPEVRLLAEGVRIDTSNPPGLTRRYVEILARELACAGIPAVVTGGDPERPILVARLKGRRDGEALALLSHADVVPAGDLAGWSKPPFAGERGDKLEAAHLVGRGTLDMKGQAVASLFAMRDLVRDGIVPMRDLVYVVESGEETFDPSLGFGWLLEHRPDLLAGVTDVFNEGGVNEVKTAEIERFGIEVMEKAILSVDVFGKDRAALESLAEAAREKDESLPLRQVPAVREFFAFIAPSRSDIWGRRMVDEPEKIGPKSPFWPYVPDVYRGLLKDMIYRDRIVEEPAGGFRMRVVWTLLPGSSVAEAERTLDGWISSRGLTKKIFLRTPDCVASPTEGPAWGAAVRALELDPVRAPVGPYVLSGQYTSSSWLRAHGFRAYGVSPFGVSFYDASSIHRSNERISIPVFVEGVARMCRILREFATAP